MPDEYSYNDFMQMQQQAIDRVREMQKKASPNDKPKPEPMHHVFAAPMENKPKPAVAVLSKPSPQPKKPPQFPPFEPQKKKPEHKPRQNKKQSPLSFLSNMDSDMSLILPLLLLLGKEGADNILLLALLYIIS